MKTLSSISESIVSALGWTLLHAIWQGFAVAVLAAAALFILRHRSSLLRYWVSVAALGLQLAASVFTFGWYYQPAVLTVATRLPVAALRQPVVQNALYKAVVLPWYQQVAWFLQSNLTNIVLFWGIGASVLLLRLLGNWVYVQQLKSEGIQLTEPRLQVVFKRLMNSLQINKTVHLLESARVTAPIVIGFFKPVVLLPVGLVTGLTNAQIEAVLAHELAHIKRHDYLINLLQSLVEIVYFFHPALWWVSARVRQERENCCDDCAVSVCGNKLALAQALSFVAQYQKMPALAMAINGGKMPLLHRIQRILGVSERAKMEKNNVSVIILALLMCIGVSVYAVQNEKKNSLDKPKNAGRIMNSPTDGTRIELGEKMQIEKIKWQKRDFSQAEVAEVERLRAAIEANTMTLAQVKNQTHRAVLTRVFEMNNNFVAGMKGFVEGMKALTFDSIQVNTMEQLNDNAAILNNISTKTDTLNDRQMSYHNRQIDSLSRLIEEINKNSDGLSLDMEPYRFKVEEQERKQEVLNWKKQRLQEERGKILEKRNAAIYNEDKKVKKSEAEVEKAVADYEQQIKAHEQQIADLNKQMAEISTQIQAAQQPLEKLEKQLEQINAQTDKLSTQLSKHAEAMSKLVEVPTEAEIQRLVNESVRSVKPPRPPRAAKKAASASPPRPPKPRK